MSSSDLEIDRKNISEYQQRRENQKYIKAAHILNHRLEETVNQDIENLHFQIINLNYQLQDLQRQLNYKNSIIEEIQNGKAWKFLVGVRKIRTKLFH